jgi:hypothetical protein
VTWVKWKLISVRLEIVLISAQDMCMVCVECSTAWKFFWAHPVTLLGDVGQVEALSVRLEIVLIMMQDRCTVCAEHIIGLEIILDTPDGTPR